MMALSADLTWRVLLLSAVFGVDALVFIGLWGEELRDWRLSRYTSAGEPVAKALSVPVSNRRARRHPWVVR